MSYAANTGTGGAVFRTVVMVLFGAGSLSAAEGVNETNLLRQLQERVTELEKELKELEQRTAPVAEATNASAGAIQELDQKVKVLERNNELAEEAAEAKAKETPKVNIGSQGFSLASANGDFGLQLKGVLQVDSRTFFGDSGTTGNDGFLLRRARPVVQGTVFRDFDFNFTTDFGGTGSPQIFDAYLNYKYSPALQVRGGKFKSPVGLEQLQADIYTLFNERSLVTDLVPNRDLGFQVHGDRFRGIASYAVGIFNGVGDSRNSSNGDVEDNKAFEGRVFLQPFKTSDSVFQGLGFGLGGSYESMQGRNTSGLPGTTGGTLPGYTTVGQQQFFAYNPTNRAVVLADGEHWRLSPQAYYYYGPYSLMGEYVLSNQKVARTVTAPLISERLEHSAWQLSAGWIITGEDATFGSGVVPRNPFNPLNGRWGALQLALRYSQLDIDQNAFPLFADPRTSANSAQEWSVGLNWYLNRNVRVNTSFSHTRFEGAGASRATSPGSVTRNNENVLFTRVQLGF